MDFFGQFIHVFFQYIRELWFILGIGFLLGGISYKFIPTEIIEQHLGKPGLRSIGIASITGVILPLCCMGTLPLAVTLKRKGASLGSVLAFLVATPATSVSALIVSWKLLGMTFTVAIFFAAVIMAFAIGLAGNWMEASQRSIPAAPQEECGNRCSQEQKDIPSQPLSEKIKEVFHHAFIILPKEIGGEILLAIAVASFIVSFAPLQEFIRSYLVGPSGYAFVLVFGLLDYVCSTASVPLADALMKSGMSPGQAFCYLLVGPITSYGTMLVIRKEFGGKVLWTYLGLISAMSLLLGVAYDLFIV